jgi:cell division protein FtsN
VAPPPVKIVTAPPPAAAAGNSDAAPAPARRVAAVAPPAREPTPKAASSALVTASTSGYVAVLSSQKSRMDALKAFADLQQKYGDVLSSKTPDVQEANLGDKGIWYRAVVGPPVSRDAASGICSQLKAAGYAGCWVTAY